MFVRQSKFDQVQKQLWTSQRENMSLAVQLAKVVAEHNKIVELINKKGGQYFLDNATLEKEDRFTDEELQTIRRLCHPDKHHGSMASNTITQKLNGMLG